MYTSKQCGACGEPNDKLGGSKTLNCQKCGAVADRGVHARNVLLRGL
jgi:transposase